MRCNRNSASGVPAPRRRSSASYPGSPSSARALASARVTRVGNAAAMRASASASLRSSRSWPGQNAASHCAWRGKEAVVNVGAGDAAVSQRQAVCAQVDTCRKAFEQPGHRGLQRGVVGVRAQHAQQLVQAPHGARTAQAGARQGLEQVQLAIGRRGAKFEAAALQLSQGCGRHGAAMVGHRARPTRPRRWAAPDRPLTQNPSHGPRHARPPTRSLPPRQPATHNAGLPQTPMSPTALPPLTSSAAWRALQAHQRELQPQHLRELFAADPTRGERLTLEAAGIYLDYSKNRITDETLRLLLRAGRASRACASASTRCSAARRSTSPRTAPCCTWRCARRAAQSIVRRRRRTSCPQVHAVLDRMAAFAERVRSGDVDGPHRQAHPQRRQHRHRRLRPRPGDGLRGAAALQRRAT